ncbi:MAG: phenylalanine--tRNA ligase subunit alpha [Chloroflexi bacterium]|nr:phenylalanine--tRNA ligase subunit alpha [Chloroflexota bacterium]
MLDELNKLRDDALAQLSPIWDDAALEAWRVKFIGRNGALASAMTKLGALAKEERPAAGKLANEVKTALESAFEAKVGAMKQRGLSESLEAAPLDVTLPGRPVKRGRLHPATANLRELYRIWGDMGFQVFLSREVESDEVNFQYLNIPPHHPARDNWSTFYIADTDHRVLLRPHTSPGQIRAMRQLGHASRGTQPIRVILPGMCFRYEQASVRYDIQFNQLEGLAVGRNITFADLKGTLTEFARRMYGDRPVRFYGDHFPFTEPSAQMDVQCVICDGKGCAICKHTGFLEILGSGMVHPTVLRNGGYDPAEWSGFAFGMGTERIAMLKHGIEDIRYFWGNDLRFLEQF